MMEIIEYYTAENKRYWLEEIGKSDWVRDSICISSLEKTS